MELLASAGTGPSTAVLSKKEKRKAKKAQGQVGMSRFGVVRGVLVSGGGRGLAQPPPHTHTHTHTHTLFRGEANSSSTLQGPKAAMPSRVGVLRPS